MFRVNMLSEFDGIRENNFTLLRLIFACAVLFGHSSPIVNAGYDPLSRILMPAYPWLGQLSVGGFFVISGFLVTASFQNRGALSFVVSRALRLYPAILAYSFVTILILGPVVATVPLKTYFNDTLVTFWNATLWEWKYNLPYVFVANHFSGATNGSAWTLPVELRCYIFVFLAGILGLFEKTYRANIVLLGLLVVVIRSNDVLPALGFEARASESVTCFLLGSLAWINRRFIPLNPTAAVVLAFIPLIAVKSGWSLTFFKFSFPYIVLVLAYQAKHIDLDRFGDISYGVYIYAWPAQQLVWSPGQSMLTNALLAFAIVLPTAYLSWRLVEKPALGLRIKFAAQRRAPPSDQILAMPMSPPDRLVFTKKNSRSN